MKIIIYKKPDGVIIRNLSWDFINQLIAEKGMTEDEAVEFLGAKNPPSTALSWRVIDDSELPSEQLERGPGVHTLRNAWEDTGISITTNMPKARGIHMDNIREVRNKELVKKDIEFMKAIEADDGSFTAIAIEKQVLRDIPQTFDLTTDTPEELKQKWPEGLPKE
jgi:hypothetical protein